MFNGLFDFQINGFAGVDFQRDDWNAAALHRAFSSLRGHGLVRCFVTLITDDVDRLCRRLQRFEEARAKDALVDDMIAGYHLEGPWLSPEPGYSGAHDPHLMRSPAAADFDRLQQAANGKVRLVTLAPEWPGSAEFIAKLRQEGVHCALGHTNAGEKDIAAAVAAGARFCTHLGNAVPMVLPRHDNIVQRLLARDELTACFIPDGRHLPPYVLRNYVRAKPRGKVLFTTDAMAGAGAPAGSYTLGSLPVEVGVDGVAHQPDGNGFAGSTLTPDEGVRRCASYLGLALPEAVRLWSEAPAAAFGVMLASPVG